ncbi:unnamed protein product [Closterium sp. Naga37s-1]|nr:unnamed protein product [Closterium sp. Naga37s-1]
MSDDTETNDVPKDASRDMQQQSRALDSITDHVEERQLDSRRVQEAMASIAASSAADRDAQRAREKELAAVKIDSVHIDVIASEMEDGLDSLGEGLSSLSLGNAALGGGRAAASAQRAANWKATGIIALRDAHLKSIPDAVFEAAGSARTLDASNNRIVEIPEAIGRLTSLQRLVLPTNRIERLPASIGLLSSLKALQLENNRLTELPNEIGSLSRLERLSLATNKLQHLPDSIGQLSALITLDVSSNCLSSLPPTPPPHAPSRLSCPSIALSPLSPNNPPSQLVTLDTTASQVSPLRWYNSLTSALSPSIITDSLMYVMFRTDLPLSNGTNAALSAFESTLLPPPSSLLPPPPPSSLLPPPSLLLPPPSSLLPPPSSLLPPPSSLLPPPSSLLPPPSSLLPPPSSLLPPPSSLLPPPSSLLPPPSSLLPPPSSLLPPPSSLLPPPSSLLPPPSSLLPPPSSLLPPPSSLLPPPSSLLPPLLTPSSPPRSFPPLPPHCNVSFPTSTQLPAQLLVKCQRLHTVTLRGNAVTLEQFELMEGYNEFEERRKIKVDKRIAANVLLNDQSLDIGIDRT